MFDGGVGEKFSAPKIAYDKFGPNQCVFDSGYRSPDSLVPCCFSIHVAIATSLLSYFCCSALGKIPKQLLPICDFEFIVYLGSRDFTGN